jgi:hypothetical protein
MNILTKICEYRMLDMNKKKFNKNCIYSKFYPNHKFIVLFILYTEDNVSKVINIKTLLNII